MHTSKTALGGLSYVQAKLLENFDSHTFTCEGVSSKLHGSKASWHTEPSSAGSARKQMKHTFKILGHETYMEASDIRHDLLQARCCLHQWSPRECTRVPLVASLAPALHDSCQCKYWESHMNEVPHLMGRSRANDGSKSMGGVRHQETQTFTAPPRRGTRWTSGVTDSRSVRRTGIEAEGTIKRAMNSAVDLRLEPQQLTQAKHRQNHQKTAAHQPTNTTSRESTNTTRKTPADHAPRTPYTEGSVTALVTWENMLFMVPT